MIFTFYQIDEEGVIDGDSLIAMAMDPMKPALEEVVKNCKKDISEYLPYVLLF